MSKNAKILKEIRGKQTVAEFAKKLGCNRTYYYQLESGFHELSLRILQRLKQLYPKLDMNVFFEE